ncbi:TPA: restriction endonuclease subunit S [Staphylococcus delphini]|nr:restriction endonuclease subunit S [Staphylococcus delphini]
MTDLKKNIPKLRFPEFEGEWEEKKLGEIVSFGKGKLLGKKDLVEDGKYPCILYGELYTKYGAIINNIESRTNVDPSKLKKADKNQILIPSSGETVEDIATASAINVTEDVYIGGDLNILTPQKDDGRFISLSLNSVNKWNVSRFAQGKTVVHLYNSDLKNLKINLPCQFEEQQKIGDFFSKLDRQIELEEQKLAFLKEQKKGYIQKIFSQELRFKDDNGNDYPEWEEKRFLDLFKVIPSKDKQINSRDVLENGRFPVVDQGKKLFLGYSNEKSKVIENFEDLIIYGDHTTIIKRINEPFIIGGDGVKLLTGIDEKPINYLYVLLQYSNVVPEGYKRHYSILKTRNMYVSTFAEEQCKIGNFFRGLDMLIEKQSRKVELLKQRKKGLLQKMFV